MSRIITEVISVFGIAALVLIGLFCLVCGVVKANDLFEEYPILTKKCLKWGGIITCILHALLHLVDGYPLFPTIIGIFSQVAYSINQKQFPLVEINSINFMALLGVCLLNHFVWFFYFLNLPKIHHLTLELATFFLFVIWLIPLIYFLSLSSPDQFLPNHEKKNGRNGLIKGLFGNFFQSNSNSLAGKTE